MIAPNTTAASIHSEDLVTDYVDAINAIDAAIEAVQGLYPQRQYYKTVTQYRDATDQLARQFVKLQEVKEELRKIADEIEKLA